MSALSVVSVFENLASVVSAGHLKLHLWNFWPVKNGCQTARVEQTARKQWSVYILTFIFHMGLFS